jgi:hypothetical protein
MWQVGKIKMKYNIVIILKGVDKYIMKASM